MLLLLLLAAAGRCVLQGFTHHFEGGVLQQQQEQSSSPVSGLNKASVAVDNGITCVSSVNQLASLRVLVTGTTTAAEGGEKEHHTKTEPTRIETDAKAPRHNSNPTSAVHNSCSPMPCRPCSIAGTAHVHGGQAAPRVPRAPWHLLLPVCWGTALLTPHPG